MLTNPITADIDSSNLHNNDGRMKRVIPMNFPDNYAYGNFTNKILTSIIICFTLHPNQAGTLPDNTTMCSNIIPQTEESTKNGENRWYKDFRKLWNLYNNVIIPKRATFCTLDIWLRIRHHIRH